MILHEETEAGLKGCDSECTPIQQFVKMQSRLCLTDHVMGTNDNLVITLANYGIPIIEVMMDMSSKGPISATGIFEISLYYMGLLNPH